VGQRSDQRNEIIRPMIPYRSIEASAAQRIRDDVPQSDTRVEQRGKPILIRTFVEVDDAPDGTGQFPELVLWMGIVAVGTQRRFAGQAPEE
jgi:hypothetical protein